MEGVSIILPVCNKVETTLSCVESIRKCNEDSPYEIIIVDNGSADATQETFEQAKGAGQGEGVNIKDTTYIRNEENLGVAKACNTGAGAARYDTLCFMHNDVFLFSRDWTGELRSFITSHTDAGIVGLYGAKILRSDGSFRGKTIIHAMRDGAAMDRPHEKAAVVDGLLMAMSRTVYERTGGFDEAFSMHFYDKDISMRAVQCAYTNYILKIPFEHRCGTTRKDIMGEDTERKAARRKFTEQWKSRLPVDVTTWREKLSYLVRRR